MTVVVKVSAILILLSLLLLAAYPVWAQDATGTSTIRKEKMSTREAALKTKLDKFKDKKKAEVADRVNSNLNQINEKQTMQMLKHLDKMSALLTKLEARVNKGTSISNAKTAIASATAAVKAQSEKDYTIQVTTESKIRKDAQKVRDGLHTDLKNVRKLVIDAKQAVGKAIRNGQ